MKDRAKITVSEINAAVTFIHFAAAILIAAFWGACFGLLRVAIPGVISLSVVVIAAIAGFAFGLIMMWILP